MKSIYHIPSPPSLPFTSPPRTVPILQSCLSLFPKSMFKGVSQCIPAVSILYFGPFNPLHCSSSHPLFSNSFQHISLYPLPSQMVCFTILLIFDRSLFFSLLPQVPQNSFTIVNIFYMWVCHYSKHMSLWLSKTPLCMYTTFNNLW
jgi:hypothetical protein